MLKSVSDLCLFVDDDTPLDKTYLTRALEIKQTWPFLGVWGSGSVIPEYEIKPDESLSKLLPAFGLRQVERALWSNVFTCMKSMPWGAAGVCPASN